MKSSSTEETLSELRALGWRGEQSHIYAAGYTISDNRQAVVNSPAAAEGRIFIQNQSSWLPVLALDPQPGEKILDMCAAPGGKASMVAELTGNEVELWVNDNSRARLYKLEANFKRLGTMYSQRTLSGIERIGRALEGEQFDKILIDAPCSGEGLMNLEDNKSFTYWSVPHIKRLQQLQKKSVLQAWNLLKQGGTLVYSTCTMAPEENEAVVDYLLRKQEDANLEPSGIIIDAAVPPLKAWNTKAYSSDLHHCFRVRPSRYFEAFFVAKISKL